MRYGFLAAVASLLVSVGSVRAQPEPPQDPPPAREKLPRNLLPSLPDFKGLLQPAPVRRREPVPEPEPVAEKPRATPAPAAATEPVLNFFRGGSWLEPPVEGSYWASGEFMIFMMKRPHMAPALLTGPNTIIPPPEEGGEATEGPPAILVGGGNLDYPEAPALRLTGGYWFDDSRCLGVEASFLYLNKRSRGSRVDDDTVLQRPFRNLLTRETSTVIVAQPGVAGGDFAFNATTRTWGLEANLWKNLFYEPVFDCMRVDLICGLRYLDLAETIRVDRSSAFAADLTGTPQFLALQGNQLYETESIRAHNSFYGAQAGAAFKLFMEHCVIDMRVKVAAGVNQERLHIAGEQLRVRPDGTRTTAAGALIALPSNIGRHRREQFSWIPELNFNVGIPLTNNIGLFGGYTFIYWGSVARPSEQIDPVVDAAQVPSLPPIVPPTTKLGRPSVPFTQAAWWAHGINIGLEFSW